MNKKSRQSILSFIEKNIDDVSIDNRPESVTSNKLLSIVNFAKSKWNITTALVYSESMSPEDAFESNGLHLREISITKTPKRDRMVGNMILYVLDDSTPLLCFAERGRYYYFEPEGGKILSESDCRVNQKKIVAAFEIFRQLPWFVKNPLTLMKISIDGDNGKFLLIVVVSLLVMVLGLSTPILTGFLTNTVIPSSNISLLIESLVPCIIILIVTALMNYFQGLALLLTETSVDVKLQTAIWQKVYKLPMEFFEKYSPGDLLSRINAVSAIRKAIGNQSLLSVLQLLFSVVFFILMLVYDWQLAIGAIVVSIISLSIIIFMLFRQMRFQERYVEAQAELTNFAYQCITGIPQIRSTNTEPFLLNQWYLKVENAIKLQRNIEFWQGTLSSFSNINQTLGTAVLFSLIVYKLVLRKEAPTSLEVGMIIVTFMPFYQAYTSFNSQLQSVITTIGEVVAEVIVQWKRAKPVLYQQEEVGFAPDSLNVDIKGEVEFANVAFSFSKDIPPLFSNINIKIPQGSFTALTGESGCGKSTLMKLLLGFIDPTEGSINVDGISLKQMDIRRFRRQLGVVLQTTKLPPGSLFDVICAGRQYSEKEVWDALEICAIAKQVRDFPMGLDTVITESPAISGGQRQRIGLARALISNPRILLLDEATSALDSASQKIIGDAISNLGITRIVIAHRLSTIKEADQIVFIKNSSVFASGTFEELLSKGIFQ